MPARILPRRVAKRFSLADLFCRFAHRHALRRERRRLALLDDHLLRDIGISREAALREAERSDWPAPDHWIR